MSSFTCSPAQPMTTFLILNGWRLYNCVSLRILYFVCVTGRDAEDVDEDYDISLKVMLDSNLFTTAFGFFNEKFV